MVLPLLALIPHTARAADLDLYARAQARVDALALHVASCSAEARRDDVARSLEEAVPWLVARPTVSGVQLVSEGWQATVEGDGAGLLAGLEDALSGAPRALPPDTNLRVALLRGYVRCLDRYSVVLADEGLERFDERLGGTISGIGATIRRTEAGLRVQGLVPDAPAAMAGLLVGDEVVRVDGIGTLGMRVDDLTRRIRGPEGTMVTLEVLRAGETHRLAIRRATVQVRNVRAAQDPSGVEVLTIDHFSEQTTPALRASLAEIDARGGARRGLVIDLRGNTGGSLVQSAEAADAFVAEGRLVTTTGREGAPVPGLVPRFDARPGAALPEVPIVVLVDERTASGAEILAGALRERGRAVLVGLPTFGKGTVQKLYPLADGVKLKLTVAEYRVGDGVAVADVGVTPDIAIDTVEEEGQHLRAPGHARIEARRGNARVLVDLAASGDDPAMALALRIAGEAAGAGVHRREDVLAVAGRLAEEAGKAGNDALLQARRAHEGLVTASSSSLRAVRIRPRGQVRAGGRATFDVTLDAGDTGVDDGWLRLAADIAPVDGIVLPVPATPARMARTWTVDLAFDDDLLARQVSIEASLQTSAGTVSFGAGGFGVEALPSAPLSLTVEPSNATDGRVGLGVQLAPQRAASSARQVRATLRMPEVDGVELLAASLGPVDVAGDAPLRGELALAWRGKGGRPDLPLVFDLRAEGWAQTLSWTLPQQIPRRVVLSPPAVEARAEVGAGGVSIRIDATDDRALGSVSVSVTPERVEHRLGARTTVVAWDRVAWNPLSGTTASYAWTGHLSPGAYVARVRVEDAEGLATTESRWFSVPTR